MADILYIVVPCYNEEEVLPETSRRLREKLEALMAAGKIAAKSRVLFVNDGSKDRTWELISSLHGECPLFCGVDLSRNRGHQNALLAGLMTAKDRCDMAISMDADLQDDIDAVDAMVEEYYAGCDIVYGVRSARKKDTFFKRFTAEGFYRLMNFMGAETVFNHADYRLMSKRALEGLAQFKEVNLFLRGIVPMIGYRTGTVEYERGERFAGESKYPLKKMVSFAMEGITSLSTKPIRYITGLGFLIFLVSILMLIYSIVRWAMGDTIIGWASMICSVWAIGGLILLSLGVIGEYIGKIRETKVRQNLEIPLSQEEQIIAACQQLQLAYWFDKPASRRQLRQMISSYTDHYGSVESHLFLAYWVVSTLDQYARGGYPVPPIPESIRDDMQQRLDACYDGYFYRVVPEDLPDLLSTYYSCVVQAGLIPYAEETK